jgi:hypothetical protein
MFIQVIRGKVKDPAAMRTQADKWQKELAPSAVGFLGATEGVTDDGTFVAVARFESEEAARANSDKPEQTAWWKETEKLFDGAPKFYDCPRVETFMSGGRDDAGFVQIMMYKTKDYDALQEMMKQMGDVSEQRPDIIGGTSALASDGNTVIDTSYFTSEKEAREGEKKEMPAEDQKAMERFGQLTEGLEYIDIRDPWLYSA